MGTDGIFRISGTSEATREMRYDAFRAEMGFCASYWVIARPGVRLDGATAVRWGLRANTGSVGARGSYVTRLFLAALDEDGFEKGRYYACDAMGAPSAFAPIALHALSLESLRLLLVWARRLHALPASAADRAPNFPPEPLPAPRALDAIDHFCVAHPGVVIGPPPRSS